MVISVRKKDVYLESLKALAKFCSLTKNDAVFIPSGSIWM